MGSLVLLGRRAGVRYLSRSVLRTMILTMNSVCTCGTIRLIFSLLTNNSIDFTWKGFHLWFWASLEINLGIICACVPTLKLLVARAIPTLRSWDHSSTPHNSRAACAVSWPRSIVERRRRLQKPRSKPKRQPASLLHSVELRRGSRFESKEMVGDMENSLESVNDNSSETQNLWSGRCIPLPPTHVGFHSRETLEAG